VKIAGYYSPSRKRWMTQIGAKSHDLNEAPFAASAIDSTIEIQILDAFRSVLVREEFTSFDCRHDRPIDASQDGSAFNIKEIFEPMISRTASFRTQCGSYGALPLERNHKVWKPASGSPHSVYCPTHHPVQPDSASGGMFSYYIGPQPEECDWFFFFGHSGKTVVCTAAERRFHRHVSGTAANAVAVFFTIQVDSCRVLWRRGRSPDSSTHPQCVAPKRSRLPVDQPYLFINFLLSSCTYCLVSIVVSDALN